MTTNNVVSQSKKRFETLKALLAAFGNVIELLLWFCNEKNIMPFF